MYCISVDLQFLFSSLTWLGSIRFLSFNISGLRNKLGSVEQGTHIQTNQSIPDLLLNNEFSFEHMEAHTFRYHF